MPTWGLDDQPAATERTYYCHNQVCSRPLQPLWVWLKRASTVDVTRSATPRGWSSALSPRHDSTSASIASLHRDLELTEEDLARVAVNRNPISFVERNVANVSARGRGIDHEPSAAHDTGLPHGVRSGRHEPCDRPSQLARQLKWRGPQGAPARQPRRSREALGAIRVENPLPSPGKEEHDASTPVTVMLAADIVSISRCIVRSRNDAVTQRSVVESSPRDHCLGQTNPGFITTSFMARR
jgi:hypothetical protein